MDSFDKVAWARRIACLVAALALAFAILPNRTAVTGAGMWGVFPDVSASLAFGSAGLRSGASEAAPGDGTTNRQLNVSPNRPVAYKRLRADPAGQLTNRSVTSSALPILRYAVPLFPRSNDPSGRQGFVRVVNRSGIAGEVSIKAYDDSARSYERVLLAIGAKETTHFNSDDLEQGNRAKGLPVGVGTGVGDWRLELASELDIEVLSYIRTPDGFLTSMHDTAQTREGRYVVHTFNPGSNIKQRSLLRVINRGDQEAQVSIRGIDDKGESPGRDVEFPVAAGAARTLTAADLEWGTEGLRGALGDGAGKWQLLVESEQPLVVMSLLESPGGHLTNLSSSRDTTRVSKAVETPDTPVAAPWHFTQLHYVFETTPADFETLCIDFAMESDVDGEIPIYVSVINQWINGLRLYAGIQTGIDGLASRGGPKEKRGRGAIFSRWEERDFDAIRPAPGGLFESSGHEGDFIGVRNDFAWSQGAYRLCLVKGARVDGDPLPDDYRKEDIAHSWGRLVHTWVRLEATDLTTGDTTFVGALAFPGETLALGLTTVAFYEAYGRQSFIPQEIPSFVVALKHIQVDGEPVRFIAIREHVNGNRPNAPVMANSIMRGNGTIATRVGRFTGEHGRFWRELYPDD